MYEAHFFLRQRPFAAAPQSDCFFAASGIESARQNLIRIITRAEGAGLIIGPSGTGKTLLCQSLAAALENRLTTALLASGRICTRRALLQAILFELRQPYRGLEEGELRLALMDYLSTPQASSGTAKPTGTAGLLLLVDEAHTLPLRLLEELRMITNLVRDGEPRVRLILAGSPALEERFASPKLDSFSQRVASRFYLSALNREETTGYVRYQISSVGGEPERVFEHSAYESIYRATDGIPRLINQVCDHALILTALGECRSVTAAAIEEAWGDLQQLPTPWQTAAPGAQPAATIVEFAALDDISPEAPALRFPSPAASINPEQQIERIQQQLAEVEDDFRPAGSIGPELELVFNEAPDPFGEAFDEEEVVIDRYASLEADMFAQRPVVNSREGSELAHLLAPLMNKVSAPTLSMPSVDAAGSVDAAPQRGGNWPSDAAAVAGRSDSQRRHDSAEHGPAAGFPAVTPIMGDFDDFADDSDLIVIEDELPEAPQSIASSPRVRRQEYRQLFAKMRRG